MAVTCLRCGRQGYKTSETGLVRLPGKQAMPVVVQVDLCQVCRTAARNENKAARGRGGPGL